jgi:hypothetical protein
MNQESHRFIGFADRQTCESATAHAQVDRQLGLRCCVRSSRDSSWPAPHGGEIADCMATLRCAVLSERAGQRIRLNTQRGDTGCARIAGGIGIRARNRAELSALGKRPGDRHRPEAGDLKLDADRRSILGDRVSRNRHLPGPVIARACAACHRRVEGAEISTAVVVENQRLTRQILDNRETVAARPVVHRLDFRTNNQRWMKRAIVRAVGGRECISHLTAARCRTQIRLLGGQPGRRPPLIPLLEA